MGKNCDIVRGLYEAFAKGDVPAVLGAFDPRIQWREAEGYIYAAGNPYVGPNTVATGVFQRLGSDVQNFAVVPGSFFDAGDTVVVEGRYRGTIKATGKPIDAQFAHIWQFNHERVVRFQQYTDTKQWSDASESRPS